MPLKETNLTGPLARALALVAGLVLGVGLLVLLLRTVSGDVLASAFAHVDYTYLLIALVPFLLTFGIKVTRWGLLFGQDSPTWWTLFGAISVGYGVNTVLPLRLGEVVTAYWVRDRSRVGMARALGTIAVERITDGVAVLLILVVFAPTVAFPRALVAPTIVVGGLMVAGLAALVVVALMSAPEAGWAQRIIARFRETPLRVVVEMLGQALTGVRALRDPGALSLYLAYTVIIWVSNSVLFWLLVRAFHLDVPLSAGFLLTGVLFLGMAVPSSPGYLGVFDYLMVLTLSLYDVRHGPAVAAALAAHFINFVPVTVVGLLLLARHGETLVLSLASRSSRPEERPYS